MEGMANQVNTLATYSLRWWRTGAFPVLLLFAALLASLYLLSNATENSAEIGPYYGWLLLGNAMGLLILAGILGYQLYRLLTEYWHKRAGIRLTLRMVVVFIVLAVVPVSLIYLLSVQFLQRGIDSWFDVRIEAALNDSLALSRDAMADRIREKARSTHRMAQSLADRPTSLVILDMVDMRLASAATEIALLDTSGRVFAYSNEDPGVLVPNTPNELVYRQLRQGYPYLDMEPIEDQGFFIRVVMEIPDSAETLSGEKRLLQALYPVSARLNTLAQSVQSAFAAYRELSYIRDDLKKSFILTLSLALALNILVAIIVAVMSARHLVEPVRILVDGTRAVATGDYDKRLPVTTRDELGQLVSSFNDMTQRIAAASKQARQSQEIAEEERAYVQAILARLSSGVITLNAQRCIVTMNPMARTILNVKADDDITATAIDALASSYPHLSALADCINQNLNRKPSGWQEEVAIMGHRGKQILMVNGALLSPEQGHEGEHVIMFDDVTDFVRAQRNAAWGEMARRLAHEIKNPLTPIQLSAERVRHKCLKTIDGEAAEMLDKATSTIIEQVEAMKEMVNAFTQYARSPELNLQPLPLNQLIRDTVEMYQESSAQYRIELDLDSTNPLVLADANRVRQLLHNLVRNALDAMLEQGDGKLRITTRQAARSTGETVTLSLEDDGPGFGKGILDDAFEPYVTTKQHGTGLGLAIVKKIVEEHQGMIELDNRSEGGAHITICLPAVIQENSGVMSSHA